MRETRTSTGAITALAVAVLGALAFLGQILHGHPALASSFDDDEADAKKPIKIPGLVYEDPVEHFQLLPFNIPVIRDGRVERIISMVVTLETKGDANKFKIMAERYRLQDAFLRDMFSVAAFRRADGKIIDPQVLKTRLMLLSDRILGDDVVEDVLVQSIFDRKIR